MRKITTAFATFDGASARAYIYERAKKRLTPLDGFPLEGARKPEFDSERPRVFQSVGEMRSAVEPQTDPEKELERAFVAGVARRLEAVRSKGGFDRLIVAAPPRVLGYWREVAPSSLVSVVKNEVTGDYVNKDEVSLLPIVEDAFWG
ncbi:host attachment protein [Amphiplicatus metriothermophilus]|uniref:Protein required for attachment to host cells n=1 Tax=Amphiplicatus metriothermophilus TaxID=1519374 RepID=A0A239PY80_9PROT|nr:host attachment protein [Amphiplicatus metriothermophilus]MBB5519774.1 protein required for attachment to host cells [Amphiplicatus metriothermophilus]SNT75215.1 Protein required for attachment to host cells [Amphiplicatus metriothermophilus]